jgi:4-alpha-glucanotransferase
VWDGHHRFHPERLEAMRTRGATGHHDLMFHCWVQHHLHRQLGEAADHARSRGVALKGDLPIGVSPTSVETWVHPELFHLGTQAGAPPDAFAVRGQNWGFPTYDWDRMADDGYAWWRERFRAMAEHVDVYRIDHVLGFFRIWEIPRHAVDGLLGRFRPCLPLSADEIAAALGDIPVDRLLRPTVDVELLETRFGEDAEQVRARCFSGPDDDLVLSGGPTTQQEVVAAFAGGAFGRLADTTRADIRRGLLDIVADVMLMEVEGGYHPRISWEATETYRRMPPEQQAAFDALAIDFFHRRHDELWEEQGRTALAAVVDATDMLSCGEDLGMVPEFVPGVMNDLGLLSLEIERMPKSLGAWISDPGRAPYLSVVSPGTHDTSPLRDWWQEDPGITERYWHAALGRWGDPPASATPEVIEAIIRRHLAGPAMLCIAPLTDMLAMDEDLRRSDGTTERVNDPADRHHRWRHRLHVTVEDRAAAEGFTARLRTLLAETDR